MDNIYNNIYKFIIKLDLSQLFYPYFILNLQIFIILKIIYYKIYTYYFNISKLPTFILLIKILIYFSYKYF